MFSLVGGIYDAYFSPPKLNLLLVGAPYVGKTTVLERCKVTQFNRSKKATVNLQESERLPVHVLLGTAAGSADSANDIDIVETPVLPKARPSLATTFRQNSRRWLVCPAPKKYAFNVADDDDEDEVMEEEEEMEPLTTASPSTESSTPPPSIPEKEAMENQNRQESMESVELQDSSGGAATKDTNNVPPHPQHHSAAAKPTAASPDFDLKPNAKMLPLRKIRPTIGMNLGKNLDICGAKCNVWDLGGRLEDLWERYYHDCDAVVFVWKVTARESGDDENGDQNGDNDDSDSDDERTELTPQMQLRLLEKVRSSIPDDIPFLVVGHYVTPSPIPHCRPDTLYSTAQLLPHYHNPCQALYFCNAGTGQGVRSAMEWLIPLAKRQQNIRDRSSSTKDADVDGVAKGS
jgi:GTPase SAR1 family protein